MVKIDNADGAITITNEVFTNLAGDAPRLPLRHFALSIVRRTLD